MSYWSRDQADSTMKNGEEGVLCSGCQMGGMRVGVRLKNRRPAQQRPGCQCCFTQQRQRRSQEEDPQGHEQDPLCDLRSEFGLRRRLGW